MRRATLLRNHWSQGCRNVGALCWAPRPCRSQSPVRFSNIQNPNAFKKRIHNVNPFKHPRCKYTLPARSRGRKSMHRCPPVRRGIVPCRAPSSAAGGTATATTTASLSQDDRATFEAVSIMMRIASDPFSWSGLTLTAAAVVPSPAAAWPTLSTITTLATSAS